MELAVEIEAKEERGKKDYGLFAEHAFSCPASTGWLELGLRPIEMRYSALSQKSKYSGRSSALTNRL